MTTQVVIDIARKYISPDLVVLFDEEVKDALQSKLPQKSIIHPLSLSYHVKKSDSIKNYERIEE